MLHIFIRATHVYFLSVVWWRFCEIILVWLLLLLNLWACLGRACNVTLCVHDKWQIFIFQETYLVMASGSPAWLHLSAFVVLTWVWSCCLVTPHLLVQTLAWFNLVRRSPLPPFYPLTQIPRSASGELVCASQLWSQRPLERSSSQHSTVAAGTLELLVHSNMWKMSSCFDVCQSSLSLLTGACRSDEGIIPSTRRICRT